jgi:hypothetical protein
MNFHLEEVTAADGTGLGVLASPIWYTTWLVAKTSGTPYIIQQHATPLTIVGGTTTIPDNVYLMKPEYKPEDKWIWPGGPVNGVPQGTIPTGASVGTAGSAVGVNKLIYSSDPDGLSRMVRAYHSITNGVKSDGTTIVDGFTGDPMTLDQPAGTYIGGIVFELIPQTP